MANSAKIDTASAVVVTLSASAVESIHQYVSADIKADRSLKKAADALMAEGIPYYAFLLDREMDARLIGDLEDGAKFTTEQSAKFDAQRKVVRDTIVQSFPKADQTLMQTKGDKLDSLRKAIKKELIDSVNSKLKNLRNALKNRQLAELVADGDEDEDGGNAQSPATVEAKLIKACNDWIIRLQKTESKKLTMNVPQAIAALKEVVKVASK